jgi:predicted neuraminidase
VIKQAGGVSGGAAKAWLVLALGGLVVSAVAEWRRFDGAAPPAAPSLVVAGAPARAFTLVERSAGSLPTPPGVPAAHASALAALPNGDLLACWWAGQRESAPDVRLYVARFRGGQWSAPQAVVDRDSLGRALHLGVRRIGNPVLWVAPDGRVHLYMVATGLGGWAASRVAQLVSTDGGQSFAVTRLLPLTPLWNTSVLVRTRPVGLSDGGWLLPAYFELGNKYPLVVSFDAQGEPRRVQRIGEARTSLQPALLPLSGSELRALMRDHGPQHRVQQAVSRDAGLSWQDEPAAALANHDNSLAGLQLASGGYVLLHNDAVAGGSPRQWLRLSTSLDAQTWVPALDVRRGVQGDEFSYPSVVQIGDQLHVTYTQQRGGIAHHVYDIRLAEGAP